MTSPGFADAGAAVAVWRPEAVLGAGDVELARVANAQRGFIHREQLMLAGLTAAAVKHRLTTGRLHVIHRDVYLFGRPRVEPLGLETAAVLHFAGRGVLSGLTAAVKLWNAIERDVEGVTLIVTGRGSRSGRGLTIHRSTTLRTSDIRLHRGLPVSSPARTAVDCAGLLTDLELESLIATFRHRRLVSDAEILEALDRTPRAKGAGRLRRLVQTPRTLARTRSPYERKLLQLIRAAQLPTPKVNARVAGDELDLFWPEFRLVVEFDGFEFDGFAFHRGRRAFKADRARDRRHGDLLRRTIRITAEDVDGTPFAVVAWIAGAIGQARALAELGSSGSPQLGSQ